MSQKFARPTAKAATNWDDEVTCPVVAPTQKIKQALQLMAGNASYLADRLDQVGDKLSDVDVQMIRLAGYPYINECTQELRMAYLTGEDTAAIMERLVEYIDTFNVN
jgi:hypothetical protein